MEICTFFTFTHVRQTCFACNFFWCILLKLFQQIRNQREILRFFYIFFEFFSNFEAKCAKNGSKNQKNVFCKCVLDFNFAPIKGFVFFISKKSQIRSTLLHSQS
jgi:hypothetical protein